MQNKDLSVPQNTDTSVETYIKQCVGEGYSGLEAHLGTIAGWAKEGIIFNGDVAPKVINPDIKDKAIVDMHEMIVAIVDKNKNNQIKTPWTLPNFFHNLLIKLKAGLGWGQVHAGLLKAIETDLEKGEQKRDGSGFQQGKVP